MHIWEQKSVAEQAGDIATLAKLQLDEKRSARGTVKALGKEEGELVLFARGCDRHYVAVCPQGLGKHLCMALKDAAVGAGGALREAGWNVPMRTRIALGFAGGFWGGRNVQVSEKYALTAADFPGSTTQELDDLWLPVATRRRRGRGRPPSGTTGCGVPGAS